MDNNGESPDKIPAPESSGGLTTRELALLHHYTDPTSPGYQNATRSAQLAGYKGVPASSQLSVQGSRTLRKARGLGVLRAILKEKGCTPERAAERLSACLDAKRKRIFLNKAGQIIEGPAEDAHYIQLQAAKFVIKLHQAFECDSRQELSAAPARHDTVQPADQMQASGQHANAMKILSETAAIDREALRDVLECDAKSAEFETQEPQSGTESSKAKGILEDDSTKA